MPLAHGKSEKVISENIREMEASGHSHAQSVAAAMHEADKAGYRNQEMRHEHERHKYGRHSPY